VGIPAISDRRDADRSSFGDVQLGIYLPRITNDRFRERKDVIFYGRAEYF